MTTNRKMLWLLVLGIAIVLGLWFATQAFAQDKPAAEPQFSEVQTLKLQNFALQQQTIQSQMALLQAAMREVEQGREALVQGIEKEHPGWLLNRQTLKWGKTPVPPKK